RLAKDGHGPEVVEPVIAWLRELKYLDDAAFARARARSLTARVLGPRLVVQRIAASGIDPEAARAVAEEAMEGGEEARARAALRKKTRGAAPADDRARSRLARFLLGRGYSGAVVQKVLGVDVDGE